MGLSWERKSAAPPVSSPARQDRCKVGGERKKERKRKKERQKERKRKKEYDKVNCNKVYFGLFRYMRHAIMREIEGKEEGK